MDRLVSGLSRSLPIALEDLLMASDSLSVASNSSSLTTESLSLASASLAMRSEGHMTESVEAAVNTQSDSTQSNTSASVNDGVTMAVMTTLGASSSTPVLPLLMAAAVRWPYVGSLDLTNVDGDALTLLGKGIFPKLKMLSLNLVRIPIATRIEGGTEGMRWALDYLGVAVHAKLALPTASSLTALRLCPAPLSACLPSLSLLLAVVSALVTMASPCISQASSYTGAVQQGPRHSPLVPPPSPPACPERSCRRSPSYRRWLAPASPSA